MCKNEIVEDFKKTLTQSFFKSGKICGIDESIIRDAYNKVKEKIEKGTSLLDSACDEFANYIISANEHHEIFEEKVPQGLDLLFSGRSGSKLYIQTLQENAPLVTNDQSLLDYDLQSLKKSFYPEDYLEANKIHSLILSLGLISLETHLKQ